MVRIKNMAREAADIEVKWSYVGAEVTRAYERLRQDAKALATRAGWNDDDSFEHEVPELKPVDRGSHNPSVVTGNQAKVLLGQLAAWAEGHQETFEIEARLRADAEARRAAEEERARAAARQRPGSNAAD